MLIELAQQFGYARATGKALRSAIGAPDRTLYQNVYEPHARGAIRVGAVFDAYSTVYERWISDLLRMWWNSKN